MPVITEEGFDTLQESTIQDDSASGDLGANVGESSAQDEDEKKKLEVEEKSSSLSKSGVDDIDDEDDDDDDDFDETLGERLWGLTEMFPEPLRNLTGSAVELSQSFVKGSYNFTCNAAWIIASSATILILPVMFELERAQMEQQQLQQQRQILLGPHAAGSGPGAMPGPAR